MTHDMSDATTRRLRIGGWSLAAALLALPAVAMRFDSGVHWSAGDFALAAVMFGIVGGLFELAARASRNLAFRLAVVLAVGCGFLQIWINLAVGIIGSEDNPANWTYFAMIPAAITAAVTARGQPGALARGMAALAGLQAAFSLLHLVDGHMTLPIDALFTLMWLLSARLFRTAAQQHAGLA